MTIPLIEGFTPATGASSGTITLTKPAGVVVGERLLLIVATDNPYSGASKINTPSGWAELKEAGTGGAVDARISVFERVANGTESATQNVSYAASTTEAVGWYLRISGVDNTAAIIVSSQTQQNSNSTSQPISGLTTTAPDSLVFYVLAFDGGDGFPFNVSGTGWTERAELQYNVSAGTVSSCWGTKDQQSVGATGTATVTSNVADSSASFQFAIAGIPGITAIVSNIQSASFSAASASLDTLKNSLSSINTANFIVSQNLIDSLKTTRSSIATHSFNALASNVKTSLEALSTINSNTFNINTSLLSSLKTYRSAITANAFDVNPSNISLAVNFSSSAQSASFVLSGGSIDSLKSHLSVSSSGAFVLNLSAVNSAVVNALKAQINSASFALSPSNLDVLKHSISTILSSSFALNPSAINSTPTIKLTVNNGSFALEGTNVDTFYQALSVFESGTFVLNLTHVNTLSAVVLGWLEGQMNIANALEARGELSPALSAKIEVNHHA